MSYYIFQATGCGAGYNTTNPNVLLNEITAVQTVPEPGTWAMMLLGSVGLGLAFRQSRRKVSFA